MVEGEAGISVITSDDSASSIGTDCNRRIFEADITSRFEYITFVIYTLSLVIDASANIADIQGAILHSQACIRALMTVDTCFRITDIQRAAIFHFDLIPAGNANTGMRRLLCIVLYAVYR